MRKVRVPPLTRKMLLSHVDVATILITTPMVTGSCKLFVSQPYYFFYFIPKLETLLLQGKDQTTSTTLGK